MHKRHRATALAAAAAFIATGGAAATVIDNTSVVVAGGDAAPDGNGVFGSFDSVVLNNAGEVTFRGFLDSTSGSATDNSGIFRSDGITSVRIVREGELAPDGNGLFSTFAISTVLNGAGQSSFHSRLTGTSGGRTDDHGIFRGDGSSLVTIAREGEAAPDGNGNFSALSAAIALNDAGQVAFLGDLPGASSGATTGVFRGNGIAITEIARRSDSAPDGNGIFGSFSDSVMIGESGDVAFSASLNNTSGGSTDNTGIFIGNGGTLTQVAREGQSAPDGNGTFSSFSSTAGVNGLGETAFVGWLTNTVGGSADDGGIFRGDGNSLVQIAREGQSAPDGNGSFSGFSNLAMNDAGGAAFRGMLTGTSGGAADDFGLFYSDGGSVVQIVREGQSSPDSNGSFSALTSVMLNEAGHAAFIATLDLGDGDSPLDEDGIFFYDEELGLLTVAREGDSFFGSTITSLSFNIGGTIGGVASDERSGLNDLGQVAYAYGLADGNVGVALWSDPRVVPEPASAAFSLSLLSLFALRRRAR